MRISEYFELGRNQPELDFVDVDIFGDTKLFIDPRAFCSYSTLFTQECRSLVESFFRQVLAALSEGDEETGLALLGYLKEPNETHLGLSKERAQGRAVGNGLAEKIWESLSKSKAASSGLVKDLEDTALLIPGIGRDIVSEITTNIIRKPLIEYTQRMCQLYGIPLCGNIDSGCMWNSILRQWESFYTELPRVNGRKLLLVPKIIVRRTLTYDVGEYYEYAIVEFLRDEELQKVKSPLVHMVKGSPHVTKKDIRSTYGSGKSVAIDKTLEHPDLLDKYRDEKDRVLSPTLSHDTFAKVMGDEDPNLVPLFEELEATEPGRYDAGKYEKAIQDLLTALFHGSLANPMSQTKLHEGRKRVDITFDNVATESTDFFTWVSQHFPAPKIYIECKNYSDDLKNPEIDQLSGRFSPSRGKVGILVCRDISDKALLEQRCKDTAKDDRGFIIFLDHNDLRELLEEYNESKTCASLGGLLKRRFDALIL